jgi:hypothetical protein
MSTTEPPFELLDWQRTKLIKFVHQFDKTYGDSSFDPQEEFTDPEILALALRVAELLDFQGEALEQFFERQFGLVGINEDDLGTMFSIAMLLDVENRIRCAAGGRN